MPFFSQCMFLSCTELQELHKTKYVKYLLWKTVLIQFSFELSKIGAVILLFSVCDEYYGNILSVSIFLEKEKHHIFIHCPHSKTKTVTFD